MVPERSSSNAPIALTRDVAEGILKGCESVQVGVLRLATRAVDAEAGKPARVNLSWRHPAGWRKLSNVTLRLISDGVAVGDVAIRPRSERIVTHGVARLARRATRLERDGTTVTAQLGLRVDSSMAGKRLRLEVEATDTRGRRQLERNVGTIRVAK
jgi:hypothetical protein